MSLQSLQHAAGVSLLTNAIEGWLHDARIKSYVFSLESHGRALHCGFYSDLADVLKVGQRVIVSGADPHSRGLRARCEKV